MPKYRNDNIETITIAVKESKSIAQVIKKLGLIPAGGNYNTINKLIIHFGLDTSHFTGQVWNRNIYKPTGSHTSHTSIKKALIRSRGHKCQRCNGEVWLDHRIPLELEHIDGNSQNNIDDNLKLLCPNCHSFTPTYRRSKNSLGVGGGIRTHKGITPAGF